MDLKSLHSLGKISREFSIFDGLKVSLHTLSAVEQQRALAELPSASANTDPALRTVILQQALLIYALDSVNGEKVSIAEAKDAVMGLQAPIFNEIYNCYDVLAQEQDAAVEELKKKLSPPKA